VGFKPTPNIAAPIAAPTIHAEPAAHHHNRAVGKTEWTYQALSSNWLLHFDSSQANGRIPTECDVVGCRPFLSRDASPTGCCDYAIGSSVSRQVLGAELGGQSARDGTIDGPAVPLSSDGGDVGFVTVPPADSQTNPPDIKMTSTRWKPDPAPI